jgi:hypothetical protein
MNDNDAREALTELRNRCIFVRKDTPQNLAIPVTLNGRIPLQALIDSGCEGSCIHQRVVERLKLLLKKLPLLIPVYNADGKPNANRPLTHCLIAKVKVLDWEEEMWLAITELGKGEIFLGHDWLQEHNPDIDWTKGTIQMQKSKGLTAEALNLPLAEDYYL